MIDGEDLSLTELAFYVPYEFELELPGLNAQINDPPLGRVGVYEEVSEAGLKFPLSHFILKLLHSYGISLYILSPNSVRYI